MVVLIRLIWALLRARLKPRIGLLDESAFAMRVWPNDLDLNVHMNSGRYVSMMDIGRVEILGRMRLLRKVFGRGWRFCICWGERTEGSEFRSSNFE